MSNTARRLRDELALVQWGSVAARPAGLALVRISHACGPVGEGGHTTMVDGWRLAGRCRGPRRAALMARTHILDS